MAGASLTILRLDDELEKLLDAPAEMRRAHLLSPTTW